MLRNLRVSGFRGLREHAMQGLGRVNLLVGTNNCGKTSLLEAIHILSMFGNPAPIWQAQVRRGELIDSASERQIDVAHLVHGHQIVDGAGFAISGRGDAGEQELTASFRFTQRADIADDDGDDEIEAPAVLEARSPVSLGLKWQSGSQKAATALAINKRGGLRDRLLVAPRGVSAMETPGVSFITTEGLSREEVIAMFESIVLTPDEATVLQALHTVEPTIERIASVGSYSRASPRDARGGLVMMVAGQRIPIGSMGDGIWRLLGVALALVRTRSGVLLVDEIDTGLHYSVLVDMWRLIYETARALDVQVFATTHSRDCYEALAAVTEAGRTDISLQRIERGKSNAIGFTEAEIQQAAERGLEVR